MAAWPFILCADRRLMSSRSPHFILVGGTRPNFVKLAPLIRALRDEPEVEVTFVHTGQHYDDNMSMQFFRGLDLPQPDLTLKVGSESHSVQTARIMVAFDEVIEQVAADLVVVVGDVNSTLACGLVAAQRQMPLAHVEAGLRSFDPTMPEEINRRLTDALAEFCFTPSREANENLRREGIDESRIHFVGNIMIDTLVGLKERGLQRRFSQEMGLNIGGYALLTLHRPSNVDNVKQLKTFFRVVNEMQEVMPVVFPLHPRTRARLIEFGLEADWKRLPNFHMLDALGYIEFLGLMMDARVVLTDSGGVQEETTFLGVPCLTLRENTERTVTVSEGTNTVVGIGAESILDAFHRTLTAPLLVEYSVPELWDGKTAQRIVEVLLSGRP